MPEAFASLGDSSLRGRGKLGALGGLAVRGLPAAWAVRRFARDLKAALTAINPDLIHTNGIKAHLLARLASPPGVPVVWHIRDFLSARPLIARVARWASRRASGAIAISESVASDARSVLGNTPVRLVYNAVDVETFRPGPGDGPRLDHLAGLEPPPEATVRVGLVATYAIWKGQDLLLKAISRIPPEIPARFYIVGGPIYQTKGSQFSEAGLKAIAAESGVSDRVAFVPFQSGTADVYRALDVVVHASTLPEPFGRTIVEAMACGRPVAVSKAGGASELFQHDVDAVGFAPSDPGSLASAIVGLVNDPEKRSRIASEARRTALARFARPRLGPEVLAAYAEFSQGRFGSAGSGIEPTE